jgi:hypothetical protein
MSPLRLLSLATVSLLIMNFRCHTENELPCPEGPVNTTAVTNWSYSPYCFATPIGNGPAQTYIINSDADLQALNHCQTAPTIDFNRYTLLAGKTKLPYCGSVDSQQVTQTCGQGYTYHVKLAAGMCQASTEVMYCVLVPKIAAGTSVAFDVQQP